MNVLQAIVLGIIQGLTEFLPISSSAHLVLVPYFLNWPIPLVSFDVMLHFGTLIAVVLYFRRDIKRLIKAFFSSLVERKIGYALLVAILVLLVLLVLGQDSGVVGYCARHVASTVKYLVPLLIFGYGVWFIIGNKKADSYQRFCWLIIIGTYPAIVAALLFRNFFVKLFSKPLGVACFLLITGLLLVTGEIVYRKKHKRKKDLKQVRLLDSIIIGCFQAAAIIPGISRSGATIASGLFRGITRDEAARFSFLLAIPIILGATFDAVVELTVKLAKAPKVSFNFALAAGFLAALISGYLAIDYLLQFLKKGKLYIFAYYCWIAGLATIVVLYMR